MTDILLYLRLPTPLQLVVVPGKHTNLGVRVDMRESSEVSVHRGPSGETGLGRFSGVTSLLSKTKQSRWGGEANHPIDAGDDTQWTENLLVMRVKFQAMEAFCSVRGAYRSQLGRDRCGEIWRL